MRKVMMRCPLPATTPAQNGNPEFFTGIEVSRRQDIAGLGTQIVSCPICSSSHYVRRAYLEGDDQGLQIFSGLEAAPPFAIEVGVIVSTVAFAESYIPQIYSKMTGMSSGHALMVFGSIGSVGQKIRVLEAYRDFMRDDARARRANPNQSKDELRALQLKGDDLAWLCEKLRKCMTIRDRYAHAKYNAGGYPTSISMIPFFGDFNKRSDAVDLKLDDLQIDSYEVQVVQMEIRDYLASGVRPVR